MIYLADQFPSEYRNCLFTLNIHGQRLNRDKLERHASGYVARHMRDFAPSGDPWFRGVCVKQGLDGAVYFTDWSDTYGKERKVGLAHGLTMVATFCTYTLALLARLTGNRRSGVMLKELATTSPSPRRRAGTSSAKAGLTGRTSKGTPSEWANPERTS